MCDKEILIKFEVSGLVFKIHVIDGRMWVMFVAMQQNSATLNRMKGTVESFL